MHICTLQLEVSVPEEPAMEEEFSFGRNSRTLAFSEMHAPSHVKIKPATPADFDRDHEKARAFLVSCNIYFAICSDLFPNKQA